MKEKKSHLWKIIPYLARYKWRVVFSLLLIAGAQALTVYNPIVIKRLVDTLTLDTSVDIGAVLMLVGIFFAVRFGSDLLSGIREYIFAKVTVGVKRYISSDLFSFLLYLPVSFHTNQATGGVTRKIARGSGALSTLSFFFTGSIIPTLIEIIFIVGVFLVTFPPVFTLVFIGFVVVYVVFTFVMTDRRQKLLLLANKRDDKGSQQSIDALLNYETVKYFTNEKYEIDRYDGALSEWSDVAVKSTKKGANLNIGQGLIITVGLSALLGLAAREFMAGTASIGDFVLIISYIGRIAMPLSFLGAIYRNLKEGLADVDEMFKLFSAEKSIVEKKGAAELSVSGGHVEFRGVDFSYNKSRKVLSEVSVDMPAHKSVALVGHSGSGKSTISKLLPRLYDVGKGEILIDGTDIRDVTLESLRRHIGVVAQDTILFNDTIEHNIGYGKPDATHDEIENAAKLANIHEFIQNLPEGYETKVGERGVKLSGGEKQRVAIARMLIKNPKILIFDEATASLDSKSERIIQDSIRKISHEGRTTIVIAHRLSTIVDFDKIVVIDKGRVIEEGPHEELLKTCRTYRELWEAQQGSD